MKKAVGEYGVIDVNNDNQFNIKVDIQDADKNILHISTRADFFVVPTEKITKDMPIVEIWAT